MIVATILKSPSEYGSMAFSDVKIVVLNAVKAQYLVSLENPVPS
jgi:hypothetical protein